MTDQTFNLEESPTDSTALVAGLHATLLKTQKELRTSLEKTDHQLNVKKAELAALRWVDPATAKKAIVETLTLKFDEAREKMLHSAKFACLASSHAAMHDSYDRHENGAMKIKVKTKAFASSFETAIAPYDMDPYGLLALIITPQHIEKFADQVIAQTGCADQGMTPAKLEKRSAELINEIADLDFQSRQTATAAKSILSASGMAAHRPPTPAPPVAKPFDPFSDEILDRNNMTRPPPIDPGFGSGITVTDTNGNDITREGHRPSSDPRVSYGPGPGPVPAAAAAEAAPSAVHANWQESAQTIPAGLMRQLKSLPGKLGIHINA